MNPTRSAQKRQFIPLTTPVLFKYIKEFVREIVGEQVEVSLGDAAFFIIGFGLANHRPEVIRAYLLKMSDAINPKETVSLHGEKREMERAESMANGGAPNP